MRLGVALLVLGVLAAALAAASARADGTAGATTTATTTTTTTGTTTTTAPSYAPLSPSYLPSGCVGAGAAAIAEPGRSVLTLGTPASSRGASAYPASATIFAFGSSSGGGTACRSASVSLQSVSLLGGAVTATNVEATAGRGSVSGLAIDGTPTTLAHGGMVAVGNWAQLTIGKRVGRLAAPLVIRLLAPRNGLPAGTVIAVAFAASPQPVTKPKHHSPGAQNGSQGGRASGTTREGRSGDRSAHRHLKRDRPPPDFPASPFPFRLSGGLTEAAQDNPVVSIAMQYLGIRYQWGGASPSTGFDCSGLVQYVFGKLGVPLVHYAASQWHAPDSVWVAPNRLQPGDLVFFTGSDGTRKEPGHVGIYVDDGYFIDAPHTGSFVRIDSLSAPRVANEYVGARRIVGQELVARHLLHVDKTAASTSSVPLGFPQPMMIGTSEPLGITTAATADAVRAAPRSYWIWAGAGLGVVLILSLSAGGVFIRRRRPSKAVPSSEASS